MPTVWCGRYVKPSYRGTSVGGSVEGGSVEGESVEGGSTASAGSFVTGVAVDIVGRKNAPPDRRVNFF